MATSNRSGIVWNEIESKAIMTAFDRGERIAVIAKTHKRTASAVQSRLAALIGQRDPDFVEMTMGEYARILGVADEDFGRMSKKPVASRHNAPWDSEETNRLMTAFHESIDVAVIARQHSRNLDEVRWKIGWLLVEADDSFQHKSKEEYAGSVGMTVRCFEKIVAKHAAASRRGLY